MFWLCVSVCELFLVLGVFLVLVLACVLFKFEIPSCIAYRVVFLLACCL